MTDNFAEQFSAIQSTIAANLQTIKNLLTQARMLHAVAEKLDAAGDQETKQEIVDQVEKMNGTIEDLLNQNDQLFNAYKRVYELATKHG